MEEKKPPYALLLTIVITVAGWGTTLGVCQNQIQQNSKDIERIERIHDSDTTRLSNRQEGTDSMLQSINTQLVELNTKMSLLLTGKINQAE